MRLAEEVDYRMCSTRDEEDDRVSCSSLPLTIMIIMLTPHETSKEKGVLILFFVDLWLVILYWFWCILACWWTLAHGECDLIGMDCSWCMCSMSQRLVGLCWWFRLAPFRPEYHEAPSQIMLGSRGNWGQSWSSLHVAEVYITPNGSDETKLLETKFAKHLGLSCFFS